MWVSLVVPVAVLLATLLLQRLESRLLSTGEGDEGPHPSAVEALPDAEPLLNLGRPEAHEPPAVPVRAVRPTAA